MPRDEKAVLRAIRACLDADRDAGRARPLGHYQRLFRGFEDLVEREIARRTLSEPESPDASDPAAAVPAAEDPTRTPGEAAGGSSVGPYRLLRELGRGGQGAVHLAEDTRLSRRVALKLLAPGLLASEQVLARFRREAAIASRLDHPGICTVYEAGEAGGTPYIAMRYVEGETLAARISAARARVPSDSDAAGGRRTSSVSTRPEVIELVAIGERVARALHAAHEAGLVHRDVKPANVIVSAAGDPVVLDFGLAREEEGDGAGLTMTGTLLGTPAYMSPEQLLAQRVRLDRRTDVYSLGVTLYEALTLALPFDAPTREALYQRILTTEARDPRRLNPAVPRDLAVVLATAMEKDRDRRYKTALDLAEDLRRVRELQPIRARPVGALVRAGRWAQRNPALASAGGALFASLAAGLFVSLALLREARTERDAKDAARAAAQDALRTSEREKAAKEEALDRAEGLRLATQSAAVLPSDPALALALAVEAAERRPSLEANDAMLAAMESCDEERTLVGHEHYVAGISFTPDGRRVVTTSWDGTARVWDVATGDALHVLRHDRPLSGPPFVSSDGATLLTTTADGAAVVWDLATGRRISAHAGLGIEATDACAAMAPDGRLAACRVADRSIVLWDPATGRDVRTLGDARSLPWFRFTADGRYLVATGDGWAVWDAATGASVATDADVPGAGFAVGGACEVAEPVRSAGDVLEAFVRRGDDVGLLDLRTRAFRRLDGAEGRPFRSAISPDGRYAAAGGAEGTPCRVWRLDEPLGAPAVELGTNRGQIDGLRFTPDGRRVVTSSDFGIRVWDAETGARLSSLKPENRQFGDLAVSADGKRLADESWGNGVHVWRLDPRPLGTTFGVPGERVRECRLSPGGRTLATAQDRLRVWDLGTGAVLAETGDLTPWDGDFAFDRSGGTLFAARDAGLEAWSAAGTRRVWSRDDVRAEKGTEILGSPDGALLAVVTAAAIRVLDARSGADVSTIRPEGPGPLRGISLRFTSDGAAIVSADASGRVARWDVRTGARVGGLRVPLDRAGDLDVCEGGAVVTFTSYDGNVGRVASYDAAGGVRLGELVIDHRACRILADGSSAYARVLGRWGWFDLRTGRPASGPHVPALRGSSAPADARFVLAPHPHVPEREALWDAADGAPLYGVPADVTYALSPADAGAVLLVRGSRVVEAWPTDVLAAARARRPRALTPAERESYLDGRDESTAVATEERGRRVLLRLPPDVLDPAEMRRGILAMTDLDEPTRAAALRAATVADTSWYNNRGWELALARHPSETWIRRGLACAEQAVLREPYDPFLRDTLAGAQYRAGRFEDAVATLRGNHPPDTREGRACRATDLAFLAMALHRLGRRDEAAQALADLRTAAADPDVAADADVRRLSAEAEETLAAPVPDAEAPR